MRKSKFGTPSSARSRPNASQATPNSKGANPSWMTQATVFIHTLGWQFSYVQSLFCHSWRFGIERSVSAMILLIALLALAAWATIATFVELRRDGYRRTPTDWTRLAGRDVGQQAESGHGYR